MPKLIDITDDQVEAILDLLTIEEAKQAIVVLRKKIDQHTLENFDMPLKDTGLSDRILKALAMCKISMLRELLQYEVDDLIRMKNIGKTAVAEIEEKVFSIYKKK